MIGYLNDNFWLLMHRGGVVMWPLLALSLVAMTLVFERVWFWSKTNRRRSLEGAAEMARLLRGGRHEAARELARGDDTVYGRVVSALLDEPVVSEASAVGVVEAHRGGLERFMPTLSTIITAAPMLGILGTVSGIISSFQILSDSSMATDPRDVGQGIAEALLTTAAGLVVAIIILFPYNAFRAQLDRTLGRIESLVVAGIARGGEGGASSGQGESTSE